MSILLIRLPWEFGGVYVGLVPVYKITMIGDSGYIPPFVVFIYIIKASDIPGSSILAGVLEHIGHIRNTAGVPAAEV